MSRKVKKEGDAMADLLVALALLTFAGVVGLVMMVIALYVASAALEAAHRAKKNERVHNIVWCADYF